MGYGIVYLIQPAELVGTGRYKIGCSSKPTLNRCIDGYKNGTRYITVNECFEPMILEQKIIKSFNKKFKLTAGREYFEGNEDDMFFQFMKLVFEHKNMYIKIKKDDETKNEVNIQNENASENINENLEEININISINNESDSDTEDIFKCKYCKKIYKNNNSRINHYNNKHKKEYLQTKENKLENNKTFSCNKCGKEYINIQSKYQHQKKCVDIDSIAQENKVLKGALLNIINIRKINKNSSNN